MKRRIRLIINTILAAFSGNNYKRTLIIAFSGVFAMIFLIFLSVWSGLFGKIPSADELAAIENHVSSEIYTMDNRLLGKYFIYDRTNAALDDISEHVVNSLIATEDVRFYKHKGIDYRSLGRVFFKTLLMRDESSGGGSTITQQLAKNLYPRKRRSSFFTPFYKIREMIIARRLERIYSKNDILILYLNTVPFGENVFGISAATLRFFNKTPKQLTIEEAATLIGLLKATSFYNPRLQPERAQERRNVVLSQLARYEYITTHQADSLSLLPIKTDYNPLTHNLGPAPYFREMLRQQIMKLLDEYNLANQTDYNLYTDGLKIYTTIDFRLQRAAERALTAQIKYQQSWVTNYYRNASSARAQRLLNSLMLQSSRYKTLTANGFSEEKAKEMFSEPQAIEFFSWDSILQMEISPLDSIFKAQQIIHGALVSIDPRQGYVKAWVGGIDFRYFQFDNVDTRRQAGSTFKPFVYATALAHGISPCSYVSNELRTYKGQEDWTPTNSSGEYTGFYSMAGALANSVNTVSAYYIQQTGPEAVIQTARSAGIRSYLPPVPSLALGTANVSLLELTSSYSVFCRDDGSAIRPVWLLKIEDKDGNIIYERKRTPNPYEGLQPGIAIQVREMLKNTVDFGTAASLRHRYGLTGQLAGKTGTTQNGADSWFIGFSPGLITGVWTGLENPAFTNIYHSPITSTNSAVPFWGDYMRRLEAGSLTRDFVSGSFPSLPDSLAQNLACAPYLDVLPEENWWDILFGEPEEIKEDSVENKGKLRRWLENIF